MSLCQAMEQRLLEKLEQVELKISNSFTDWESFSDAVKATFNALQYRQVLAEEQAMLISSITNLSAIAPSAEPKAEPKAEPNSSNEDVINDLRINGNLIGSQAGSTHVGQPSGSNLARFRNHVKSSEGSKA